MKVLLAASEVAPIIKIGGLGDVAGSLPKALEEINVNMDVIVPYYPKVKVTYEIYKSFDMNVAFDGKTHKVGVWKTKLPDSNVDVILLENFDYFGSGGDNYYENSISETERFSFFDKAIVEYVKSSFNTYDLIHCNDWHTGLTTALLKDELSPDRPPTLFTIHNLMYQGVGDEDVVRRVGIVPGAHKIIDWDIEDGDLNLLQQGITSSDFVNTVSKSYAQEILTPEFGGPFVDILKAREGVLTGILNGIDYSVFPRTFTKIDWKDKKPALKRLLQREVGLKEGDYPVFSFISRIDPGQKGLDILIEAVPEIIKNNGQFILLGTGDPVWEEKFKKLSEKEEMKEMFSCNIIFDVNLANRIYEGSDFFIIPSKYEPCGLTQMISMWYGTLPIVNAVGGLKDTVIDKVNGFVFHEYKAEVLISVIKNAFEIYKTKKMDEMVGRALDEDFSWKKSALAYKDLYNKIITAHESIHI